MPEPKQVLEKGRTVLDPLMREHGFEFVTGQSGSGSGGPFARGSYVRGRRRLDMSVRWSLGLVTYHVGEASLGHEEYVFAVSGGRGAYPTQVVTYKPVVMLYASTNKTTFNSNPRAVTA